MKKSLAVALVATAVLTASATASAAAPPQHAALNHTGYWESFTYEDDTCTKTELGDGVSQYQLAPPAAGTHYTLLVLKAGSGASASEVFDNPTWRVPYWHSTGKDLSHVIVCVGAGGGS